MNKQTKIALFVLGLLVAVAASIDIRRGNPKPVTIIKVAATATYESRTFGYSFEYPKDFFVREYSGSRVSVGLPLLEGFDPLVNVETVSGTSNSFDEFALERGRSFCAATETGYAYDCGGVISDRPYKTKKGSEGREIYLALVRMDVASGARELMAFGPLYVFNISADYPRQPFTALLVYQPLSAALGEHDKKLDPEAVAQQVFVGKIETR